MHRTVVVLLSGTLLVGPVRAQAPAAIADLAWLQGCWRDTTPERTIDEQWMAPAGDNLVGVARTVKGDRLREFEAAAIRSTATGLVYEAHPSNQPAATFSLKSSGPRSLVFENTAHDFPQRIGYESPDASTLRAWIEGPGGGQTRRIEYRYRRVTCP
jgi:hypothetical protein